MGWKLPPPCTGELEDQGDPQQKMIWILSGMPADVRSSAAEAVPAEPRPGWICTYPGTDDLRYDEHD